MTPIRHLESGIDVAGLQSQLASHPELWNQYTLRTQGYGTPHKTVDDIWVRYNDFKNFDGDFQKFNEEHEPSWYPCIHFIPDAWKIARKVARKVPGKLGGVLITRIPPGGEVKPHIDNGWHAKYYEKFAVQVKGDKEQAFCFESYELRPVDGDLYTFNNGVLHWVKNESKRERITMIICVRRNDAKS